MKAIVLFSGGLDSTVLLGHVLSQGKTCIAISFEYGQRHACELIAAKTIAEDHYGVEHVVIHLDRAIFQGSSSTLIASSEEGLAPQTFVPARNLLFLSHAATIAACKNASEIYFGANRDDYGNYPDCRAPFFQALEAALCYCSSSPHPSIVCPFLQKTKAEIINLGRVLKAPLHLTWSCYDPQGNQPCGVCPACLLRAEAFAISRKKMGNSCEQSDQDGKWSEACTGMGF